MNRKEAKELLPIMQAFADGKTIEYSTNGKNWSETETPIWDDYFVYRVKPEPTKFDPKTLQPFDRVLIRRNNSSNYYWIADFVATPITNNDTRCCTIMSMDTNMVIPYNEETKHLIGTYDEAPEYYRYWEE